MPHPLTPADPPASRLYDAFVSASSGRKLSPSALLILRGSYGFTGGVTPIAACTVPCVRLHCIVRWMHLLPSSTMPTLGTGGWLSLARRGLAPRKERQACLGAHDPIPERWFMPDLFCRGTACRAHPNGTQNKRCPGLEPPRLPSTGWRTRGHGMPCPYGG